MKRSNMLFSHSLRLLGSIFTPNIILIFIVSFYGYSTTKASNKPVPTSNIGVKVYLPLVFHPPKPIINCDFESGHIGWEEKSSTDRMVINSIPNIPVHPHSGNWVAWLGTTDDELSSITQPVTILREGYSLHIWRYVLSSDSCSYPFDLLQIKLLVADELVFMSEQVLCAEYTPEGWIEFVKSGFYLGAGQNFTITIQVETNSSNSSSVFIDDISLQEMSK